MKKILGTLSIAALLLVPAVLSAETWKNVSIMDGMCSAKKAAKTPDTHTTHCAIECADSGYGVIMADGKYVKFDQAGNDQVMAALKDTKKKDHLRADVTGEMKDGVINVTTMKLVD